MFLKFLFFFNVLLLLFAAGCSREEKQEITETDLAFSDLVIVATNDFHASLDRAEALASVIRDLRKQHSDRMVYVDAGDQFQGSLEGSMSKGKAVIEFFNLLDVDAAALGNRELDYGPDVPERITVMPGEDGIGNLRTRVKEARYPILSANFIVDPPLPCAGGSRCNALGQTTVLDPHIIIQRSGMKIGIIGGTTPLTGNMTSPDYLKGKAFYALSPVLQAEAQYLRTKQNCDWVIAVLHEGFRYERDGKTLKDWGLLPVLRQVPAGLLDAVVGGHTHVQAQEVINGIPVMQTGSGAKAVGVLHLIRKGGKKSFQFDAFVPVSDTGVAFDVTNLMMNYRPIALQYKRQVVARSVAPFPNDRFRETALGNLLADCLLDTANGKAKADFALLNSGAIRSGLAPGDITYDHVFKMMPYEDNLAIAELTGAELRLLLEIATSGSMGIGAISGLQITRQDVPSGQHGPWDRDLNGDGQKEEWERNLVLQIRDSEGKRIDDKKSYHLATISYLVEGGDYHDFVYDDIPEEKIHTYGEISVRNVIIDYFKKKSPLDPREYYSEARPRIKQVRK